MRNPAFFAELFDRCMNGASEVCCILGDVMSQMVAYEVAPTTLDFVQFRRIPWQSFHRDLGPGSKRRPATLLVCMGSCPAPARRVDGRSRTSDRSASQAGAGGR